MRGSGGMKRKGLGTRGSSMVYVVFLIVLLSVFSCGYMAASRSNITAAINANHYMEAQLAAKTIHTSFSESVSSGDSPAMNRLWEAFEDDLQMVREEFDEMMDKADEGTGQEGEEGEYEERFERYLRQTLGDKEYVIRGSSSPESETDLRIEITLKAKPVEETACVHTKVMCNGFQFSMKADIVFDNSDGEVMTTGEPGRWASPDALPLYLEGNGVYRYYEDEDGDSR